MSYSGSQDSTEIKNLGSAYKLIDIILEDFDSVGNVRKGFIKLANRVYKILERHLSNINL